MKISEYTPPPPSEHLRPTSGTPFERRFDGRSMVIRSSLLTAYRTWWYWAVYICPFSVIVVINRNRSGRYETIIFVKLTQFYVRYLYTLSSFIFLFHIIGQNRLNTFQFPN